MCQNRSQNGTKAGPVCVSLSLSLTRKNICQDGRTFAHSSQMIHSVAGYGGLRAPNGVGYEFFPFLAFTVPAVWTEGAESDRACVLVPRLPVFYGVIIFSTHRLDKRFRSGHSCSCSRFSSRSFVVAPFETEDERGAVRALNTEHYAQCRDRNYDDEILIYHTCLSTLLHLAPNNVRCKSVSFPFTCTKRLKL